VVVGVASWPELTAEVRRDSQAYARYLQWREATILWLERRWGDKLKTVVEHMDEKHPHVHYVIVPELDQDGRLRIGDIHEGYRAAAQCKAEGGSPRDEKKAYQEQMKRIQDDYHAKVAVKFGLTRLGPRRQRLSREQWKEQKRQAKALARAHASLKEKVCQIEARAQEYVVEKEAEINAAAQAMIESITSQAHQRTSAVKHKALAFIAKQDERIRELNKQVSEGQMTLNAKQEELDYYRSLLEEHGLLPGLASP
jgi:hypothetical protein